MLNLPMDPSLTASARVIQAVHQAIRTGRLKAGDKLPSRLALAKQLGVNATTVGHAYRRLESQGILSSQHGSGTYVRDCEAALNQQRQARRLDTIHIVVGFADLTHCPQNLLRVVVDVIAGLQATLPESVHIRIVEAFDRDSLGQVGAGSAILLFRSKRIDNSLFQDMAQRDIPVISLWNGLQDLPIPCIDYNPQQAVRLACDHLLDCGYQRIGYIGVMGGTRGSDDIAPKFFSFTDALFRANMDYQVRHVREVNSYQAGAAALAVNDILRQGDLPDAFFVDTDEKAIEVIHALQAAGVHCPRDIGVIGYNDIPEATLCQPALTTIRLPRREAGLHAAQMLTRWLHGRDDLPSASLPPQLIVRQTTGAFVPAADQPAVVVQPEQSRRASAND